MRPFAKESSCDTTVCTTPSVGSPVVVSSVPPRKSKIAPTLPPEIFSSIGMSAPSCLSKETE